MPAEPHRDVPNLLSDQAIGALKEAIVTGRLVAGAWVSEGDLTNLLGMSKSPVREALAVLRRQGWIHATPRSGYRIRAVTVRDVRDLFDLLAVLEPVAAAKAAHGGRRYPAEVEKLAAYAVESPTHDWAHTDHLLAHYRFHHRLDALGNNRELDLALTDVHFKLHQAFATALRVAPEETPTTDHRALVEAVARYDADAAGRIAGEHIATARDWLLNILTDSDEVLDAGILGPAGDARRTGDPFPLTPP